MGTNIIDKLEHVNREIKLSIVIVSYNSAEYISFCLDSILNSSFESYEIILIDNQSKDRTPDFVNNNYPEVRVIANKKNNGFAAACNQGAKLSHGSFLLFLNPDTIIFPDTLEKCWNQYNNLDNPGALGAEMFDGQANYLSVSARKKPNVLGAIQQLLIPFRLNKNAYHQELDLNEIQKADILTGAFIYISKERFELVNGFDEDYFMYAEDIDLCMKLLKRGFNNYISKDIRIIHFKGESTKGRSLLNSFHFFISINTYLIKNTTGELSVVSRIVGVICSSFLLIFVFLNTLFKNLFKPVYIFMLFALLLNIVRQFWALKYYSDLHYFAKIPSVGLDVVYSLGAVMLFWLSGYFYKMRLNAQSIRSYIFVFVGLALIYSFLPEHLRYSRTVWFGTGILGVFLMAVTDLLVSRFFRTEVLFNEVKYIGNYGTFVSDLIPPNSKFDLNTNKFNFNRLGNNVAKKLVLFDVLDINKSLFNKKSHSENHVLGFVDRMGNNIIIGNKEKIISIRLNKWSNYAILRNERIFLKRIFDVLVSLLSILLLPYAIFRSSARIFLNNLIELLKGRLSIVSYSQKITKELDLPIAKKGILNLDELYQTPVLDLDHNLHEYCIHYQVWMDVAYLFTHMFHYIKRITHYPIED